jgi:hypothetical protein
MAREVPAVSSAAQNLEGQRDETPFRRGLPASAACRRPSTQPGTMKHAPHAGIRPADGVALYRCVSRKRIPRGKSDTLFFVRDAGVGPNSPHADNFLGVFQHLRGTTESEGTGIGLANVRRIVARHGGRTWAEAKVDEGATFYFSLPHTA